MDITINGFPVTYRADVTSIDSPTWTIRMLVLAMHRVVPLTSISFLRKDTEFTVLVTPVDGDVLRLGVTFDAKVPGDPIVVFLEPTPQRWRQSWFVPLFNLLGALLSWMATGVVDSGEFVVS
jgi:hypothetical protein